MKISIIIPSSNEAAYVEELIDFIALNSKRENLEEIIIVESFNTSKIIKVAEKSHAKLYYNLYGNHNSQMEMGAFQAKGEIIYFIKPGCIPPRGFDERIIKFVQTKQAVGCFDYVTCSSDNILVKFFTKIYNLLFKNGNQANSFFALTKLYYQSGGLKKHGNYFNLEKEILANTKSY